MALRLRVFIKEGVDLVTFRGEDTRAYVVLRTFNKKRAKTRVCKSTTSPKWNEVLFLKVDAVGRLDLTVKHKSPFSKVELGTVFVDLAALPSDSEVEFNLQIPNNGYLAFSVTALGFNPRDHIAHGYLPLAAPLTFAVPKTYRMSRRSRFIVDQTLGTEVFKVNKSGFWSLKKKLELSDLSNTPLLHTSGKFGSQYFKTFFGTRRGPHLCALRYREGDNYKIMMTMTKTEGAAAAPFYIVGRWPTRSFTFYDQQTHAQVAVVRKLPHKSYEIEIAPGTDVLLVLSSCMVLDRICQGREAEETALLATIAVVMALPLILLV